MRMLISRFNMVANDIKILFKEVEAESVRWSISHISSQLTFICSKSTIETLEKDVKYLQS